MHYSHVHSHMHQGEGELIWQLDDIHDDNVFCLINYYKLL